MVSRCQSSAQQIGFVVIQFKLENRLENYDTILDWMFSQLHVSKKGAKLIDQICRVCRTLAYLNQPQEQIETIHVAGTNGKGSTAHGPLYSKNMNLSRIVYPHLKDFRERIKINGKYIDKAFVVDFVLNHRSYFESHSLSF